MISNILDYQPDTCRYVTGDITKYFLDIFQLKICPFKIIKLPQNVMPGHEKNDQNIYFSNKNSLWYLLISIRISTLTVIKKIFEIFKIIILNLNTCKNCDAGTFYFQ